jgi:hypothetical protein
LFRGLSFYSADCTYSGRHRAIPILCLPCMLELILGSLDVITFSRSRLLLSQALCTVFCICSEITPTGESRFHISTLGIEPGSLMMGSKRVGHWTSETWCGCSEIAGSPQGSPQQPTMSGVKPEGGPAVSVKPGQKSCVRSSRIITLSARRPRRGHNDQSRRGHQCSETTLTGESRFHISTP